MSCSSDVTTDVATTTRRVRTLNAEIRTMRRNLRLGLYQGRNNGGDTSCQEREIAELFPTLPKRLQGLLTEEHKLAVRISENRDMGNDRPELRQRLTGVRREIRELIA